MNEARRELSMHVGANANNIAYVANATTGLNLIARSL